MDIKEALQELAQAIKEEVIRRMDSEIGINPRTGKNTLKGSELQKSVEVNVVSETELVFQIADYYQYVVTGWKRTGSYPNTWEQFLTNLDRWVTRKNVRLGNLTQSQIVWMLYKKMMFEGREIAARPFINYDPQGDPMVVLPFLEEFFDKWAENIFNELMKELKIFNK